METPPFKVIDELVQEKMIFKGFFLPYTAIAAMLVM